MGKLAHLTTCGAMSTIDFCIQEEACKHELAPLTTTMFDICNRVPNTYHETVGMSFVAINRILYLYIHIYLIKTF